MDEIKIIIYKDLINSIRDGIINKGDYFIIECDWSTTLIYKIALLVDKEFYLNNRKKMGRNRAHVSTCIIDHEDDGTLRRGYYVELDYTENQKDLAITLANLYRDEEDEQGELVEAFIHMAPGDIDKYHKKLPKPAQECYDRGEYTVFFAFMRRDRYDEYLANGLVKEHNPTN